MEENTEIVEEKSAEPKKKRGPYKPRKVLTVNKTRDAIIELTLSMPDRVENSYKIEIPNISGVTTGTMRNPDNFIDLIVTAIQSKFPKAALK